MHKFRKCCRRTSATVVALTLLWACAPDAATASGTPAKPGSPGMRVEHDLLGEKQVPADAYYGVQTARALENFQISGIPINHYPGFVEAWAIVKLAAARANTDVGAMKPERWRRSRRPARRCSTASTTTSSRSTGTRAAPAPRPT